MFYKKYKKDSFKESKKFFRDCFDKKFLIMLKFCFAFFTILFCSLFFITALYNLTAFLILLPFVFLFYFYLLFVLLKFLDKKDLILKQLYFDFKLQGKNDFEKLSVPVVVCSKEGFVLWENDCFREIMQEKSFVGEDFKNILKKQLGEFSYSKPENVFIEERCFRVFSKYLEISSTYVLYFEDISLYVSLKEEYSLSKPCVFYIIVDNYKEILADKKDSEKSVLIGEIDNVIEEFVDLYMGFMQKLKENEFLVVLEVRHLKSISKNKFSILKSVRDIMGDENFCLTLSIGVGAYASSLNECAKFSLQALDMALGRGGDQAAIKTPNNFEFFGGNSKGVEKNTRVRARVIAKALSKLIFDADNVILMGHKFGDLDSVGSAIGLASVIRKMGKKSYIVVDYSKSLAKSLIDSFKKQGFLDIIIQEKDAIELLEFNTLLVILDTHNPKFIESYDLYENCKNVVVIDHHRKMVDAIGDAVIFYHEPYASSTCELVCELIQYFGEQYKLSPKEAEALLCGIMLDTKNFTVKVGVRTFEAAAYLRRLGADTVSVKKFFSSSIDLYTKRTKIVTNAKIYKNCAISITDLETRDVRLICPQAADELLKIENIEASFVVYSLDGVVNITSRSLGKFNVQVIMEYLGGGGHQLQAACQIKGVTIEEAKNMLLKAIDRWLS